MAMARDNEVRKAAIKFAEVMELNEEQKGALFELVQATYETACNFTTDVACDIMEHIN